MLRLVQRSLPKERNLLRTRIRFSTAEAAPVKEDSFFDKLKRWSKITSPLLAFGFVSSFVIGNLSIRHFTESVCPAYVEFLRENYGFDDEDPVERARLAAIDATNAQGKSIYVDIMLTIYHV
jgi:hypothetical protein